MNFDVNLPEIALLRTKVEECSGITPHSLPDYEAITRAIFDKHDERLSQSTIERLWQYSTRKKPSVSQYTLDVLSRYVGYKGWHDFVESVALAQHPESGMFSEGVLDVATLSEGALMRIGWFPDRVIIVRYQGRNRFVIEESHSASLNKGDSFECLQIVLGQPMYLDRFCRAGEDTCHMPTRYVIGRNSGLTLAEVIK